MTLNFVRSCDFTYSTFLLLRQIEVFHPQNIEIGFHPRGKYPREIHVDTSWINIYPHNPRKFCGFDVDLM